MILKLTREINREVRFNCTIMKICVNVRVRYRYSKVIQTCCPCHFHYRQSCYPYHFIYNSELDMSILSTSFKFGRLYSIPLTSHVSMNAV